MSAQGITALPRPTHATTTTSSSSPAVAAPVGAPQRTPSQRAARPPTITTAQHGSPASATPRKTSADLMPAPSIPPAPSASKDGPARAYVPHAGQPTHTRGQSQSAHPPSKSATGGQSHAHRPVSAMPTPASHSSASRAPPIDATALVSGSAAYADRRASAHPTVPAPHPGVSGLPQLAMSPSIDPAVASTAISSGIPITSPAALAYFAAHPRRQQVHFGSYLLLQTLGEGEFGKVKLGVHKEWGEEVAVKLIKRDKVGTEHGTLTLDASGPKDPAKMTKVEREIQVLKDVRHPNIVRLYEVIESDRFIGIVLEYASGGELFDHILAHKYLKERDACRLFAQLISGVNYLHDKKIVHRDLKLENLLLDRNRNVIITDFGFANDFGERRDDLMATSCGSPCYAAPELVVQDGLYAGSAVDVWSCGVILYAMLAGYLPFDDDPANPEGDNINLLYKYIMATPLSFPEYIAAEPRDLLSRMLVPDPQRRIDLQGVMAHSWLAPYRELFKFTVDELERAAVEQQTKKRQIYRQQMILQQQMQEQRQLASQRERDRGANGSLAPGLPASSLSSASGLVAQPLGGKAATRPHHRHTATPTSTAASPSTSNSSSVPTAAQASDGAQRSAASSAMAAPLQESTNLAAVGRAGNGKAQAESIGDRPDHTSTVGSHAQQPSSPSVERPDKIPAASKTQRHTIQLEYQSEPRSRQSRNNADPAQQSPSRRKPTKKISAPRMAASGSDLGRAPSEADELAQGATPTAVPAVPALPALIAGAADNAAGKPGDEQATGKGRPAPGALATTPLETPSARVLSNPLPRPSTEVPFPAPAERAFSTGAGPRKVSAVDRPSTGSGFLSSSAAGVGASSRGPERSNSRHRKGMSTDKSFLSRLLSPAPSVGASQSSLATVARGEHAQKPVAQSDPPRAAKDEPAVMANGNRSGSARRKAMSLVVGRVRSGEHSSAAVNDRDRAKEAHQEPTAPREDRSLSGRLRLNSTASQASRSPGARQTANDHAQGARPGVVESGSLSRASTQRASATASDARRETPSRTPSQQPQRESLSASRQTRNSTRAQNEVYSGRNNDSSSTVGPSSGAAKKVMDWFRRKSLAKGHFSEQPPLPPLDVTPRKSVSRAPAADQAQSTPRVVVTRGEDGVQAASAEVAGGVPSSRSTSGAFSHASSTLTEATGLTSATDLSAAHGGAATSDEHTQRTRGGTGHEDKASAAPTSLATPRASSNPVETKYNENAMRFHLGAVDQSALTSRSPPAVFAEVCRALYNMGIEVRKEREEEFKLECVRRKKAHQSLIGATQGLGLSIRTSVFPPSQADYERSALRAPPTSPLPTTAASTAGGNNGGNGNGNPNNGAASTVAASAMSPSPSSIRNFLRRGSQASPSMTSVALPDITSDTQAAPPTASQQLPPTIYGEARVDGGQEVRFSVEITRIKNLPGLYSLDIRRLRGPLTSYKFLYHNVLLATSLSGRD
ncbi:unnamed protein product [Parajaminaea phylloscopi]